MGAERTFQPTEFHAVGPPIEQPDLPPDGKRLQVLVADQSMVLAVGREIVVYPELLQVMQECGLFRGFEAAERELYRAGILREEIGGISGASLQLPLNGDDAGFDVIETRLQPVAYRSFFPPEERRYRSLRRRRKVSPDNRTHLPAKAR